VEPQIEQVLPLQPGVIERRHAMKRFNRVVLMVLGCITLVTLVASRATGVADDIKLVQVVNTPTVNAQQAGTWNVGITGTPSVAVANFPATQDVNVTNSSLPVTVERTLENDGMFFSVTKPGDPDPTLAVPSGVVLTDAHVTFSVPENVPNAAALYISDGNKTFTYQLVNNTTFGAGVDLGSGILSDGGLRVVLSCYNIAGNHCQGAIMWSGYRP
jgi:hypothetical protein